MSGYSKEEVAAGEALYEEEIFDLFPALGMLLYSRLKWQVGKNDSRIVKRQYFEGDWKSVKDSLRRKYIEYEFVSNVARYYDLYLKSEKGGLKLGERYLMNKLAANIDTIKRTCNKSVGNELVNPCNFIYGDVSVKDGVLENADSAIPIIRMKFIPALLGSHGTTEEALTAYEYGIALGLATGLPYEWIYCLVEDSFLEDMRIIRETSKNTKV